MNVRRAVPLLLVLAVARLLTAQANSVPCLPTGQELVKLPEKAAENHILKATLLTIGEQVRLPSGAFGSTPTCYPQWVRQYRLGSSVNEDASDANSMFDPRPGPVLRAELGDLVEVTFLNHIDQLLFPNSDSGCDQTSTYPGTAPDRDKYPNCFALSTSTNIHYHGTHTSPDSTGDNVFLEIRPSPRGQNAQRRPIVTEALLSKSYDDFFKECEQHLLSSEGPVQWPRSWSDWPSSMRALQQGLLQTFEPALWRRNEEAIKRGAWPQYFLGNYPYCFRLPKYQQAAWPPEPPATLHEGHTPGAGSAEYDEAAMPERPLIMGQAPGTHWYHAHKHGSTTINVMNGMTGIFVIEDNSPTGYDGFIDGAYASYGGMGEKVMVINQLGSVPSMERGGGGAPGSNFAVNGRLQPKITMRGGEVQLWRIANSSARAGMYILAPEARGLSWKQTAEDGVQFADANYQKNLSQPILMAAGNRVDLLVKAPMLPQGRRSATYLVRVTNTVDPSDRPPARASATTMTLLTVEVVQNGRDMPFMPSAPPLPPYLTDITDDEVTGTKTLVFASSPPGNSQHTIDGKKFDGDVGAAVRLNKVEEWKIVNETYPNAQIAHPFHIHVNPFQIVEEFDPTEVVSTRPGAGTVTTTAQSANVTGVGTAFRQDLQVGDFIWIKGQRPVTVIAIASDTQLTISRNAGAGQGAAYDIATPRYTVNRDNNRPGQCVIDPQDSRTWKPCTPRPPGPRTWHDVYSIPSGNELLSRTGEKYKIPGHFKMRSRFVDYAGYFVLHCHILAHEDRGMMTVVHVTPLQPPYSHH